MSTTNNLENKVGHTSGCKLQSMIVGVIILLVVIAIIIIIILVINPNAANLETSAILSRTPRIISSFCEDAINKNIGKSVFCMEGSEGDNIVNGNNLVITSDEEQFTLFTRDDVFRHYFNLTIGNHGWDIWLESRYDKNLKNIYPEYYLLDDQNSSLRNYAQHIFCDDPIGSFELIEIRKSLVINAMQFTKLSINYSMKCRENSKEIKGYIRYYTETNVQKP